MSTTITADCVPGWDDRRDQVLSTVIIGIIKGSEGRLRPWPRSCRCHYFSSVLPCETVALCARSVSTLMRKAETPGHRDGAAVAPVRRQLRNSTRRLSRCCDVVSTWSPWVRKSTQSDASLPRVTPGRAEGLLRRSLFSSLAPHEGTRVQ
jgi:hypothetical protein